MPSEWTDLATYWPDILCAYTEVRCRENGQYSVFLQSAFTGWFFVVTRKRLSLQLIHTHTQNQDTNQILRFWSPCGVAVVASKPAKRWIWTRNIKTSETTSTCGLNVLIISQSTCSFFLGSEVFEGRDLKKFRGENQKKKFLQNVWLWFLKKNLFLGCSWKSGLRFRIFVDPRFVPSPRSCCVVNELLLTSLNLSYIKVRPTCLLCCLWFAVVVIAVVIRWLRRSFLPSCPAWYWYTMQESAQNTV